MEQTQDLATIPDGFHHFESLGDLLGYAEEFEVEVLYGVLKEDGQFYLALIVEPEQAEDGMPMRDVNPDSFWVKKDTPLGDDLMRRLFFEDGDGGE